MSALFVTPMLPWHLAEDRHGVFQRMRLMLDAARSVFGEVAVLLLAPSELRPDANHFARLEAIRHWMAGDLGEGFRVELAAFQIRRPAWVERFPRGHWYFGPSPLIWIDEKGMADVDAAISRSAPHLIIAHRLQAFGVLRQCRAAGAIPIVLDLDDVEHVAWARQVMMPPNWRSKRMRLIHCLPLLKEEVHALRRCRHVYVCSSRDVSRLNWIDPRRRAREVPNTVRDPYPSIAPPPERRALEVLYVGTLTYAPNKVGLLWFLEHVWPRVVAELPDARLKIIGQGSRELALPRAVMESVTPLGFVDELAPAYAGAAAVVCPVLAGGGTRIKIIEAAAHGRPVVSTKVGAEGLAFRHEESILIADSPSDFAQYLVELLSDRERRRALAEAARRKYLERYERNAAVGLLTRLFGEVRAGTNDEAPHA